MASEKFKVGDKVMLCDLTVTGIHEVKDADEKVTGHVVNLATKFKGETVILGTFCTSLVTKQ